MMHDQDIPAIHLSADELETLLETARDATGADFSPTPQGARDALVALLSHCGALTGNPGIEPSVSTPVQQDRGIVRFATDGSCIGNPGPGGWAFVVTYGDGSAGPELSGGVESTTNNRMELQAVIEALSCVGPGCATEVITDSTYVKNGCESWMKGWKRKGWRKADGKPVQNKDLWVQLDELIVDRKVDFRWTKGHAGDAQNERADTLAREAAEVMGCQ